MKTRNLLKLATLSVITLFLGVIQSCSPEQAESGGQLYDLGTVLGVRTLEGNWWGEGEVKIFMDGDTEFPDLESRLANLWEDPEE